MKQKKNLCKLEPQGNILTSEQVNVSILSYNRSSQTRFCGTLGSI